MISLHDPIEKLHLIGPSQLPALHNLGIKTMIDLIYYFPRDWQDLSQLLTISQVKINEKNNLRATLKSVNEQRTKWRRLHILHGLFEDGTGSIVATWFNQPFLRHNLKVGREYYLSGKVTVKDSMLLQNPTFELVKENTIHTAGIVPVYDLTEGVSQKQLRYWISQAIPLASKIPDLLPEKMKKELELPNLQIALRDIHFPSSIERQKIAYFRLAFEELFLFQLALLSFKSKLKGLPAPAIPLDVNVIKKFVDSLPFHLTNSQRLAIWEILKDLSRSFPMNRLLEGEVGSGKTVVAGLAMLETALGNYQSVMLAPTEILAWQHFQTLSSLFRNSDISIILWTRSHKIGDISEIADGKAKIIIGTHALLQENVKFQKIGLLVIDEQHRFGVNQRSALIRRQTQTETPQIVPHLLSMTATPIPRTLALAFYGDLDISQLRELPLGRKKIITRLVEPTKREIAYEFIRKQINAGRQMYVVTPLIESSPPAPLPLGEGGQGPGEGVKAATAEAERLKQIFPEFQIGLLHGRLSGEKKKEIMEKFMKHDLNILVSTSVIEVGVDVPNAAIMIVENAERFGLSQLHQLRGRVGRGEHQSYCLLFAGDINEYTHARLVAVVNSNDGFELAEKDLELRGAGEIIGTRQSGFIPFRLAKLSDKKLINLAKKEAEKLLHSNPSLDQHPLLKQKVELIAHNAHLE